MAQFNVHILFAILCIKYYAFFKLCCTISVAIYKSLLTIKTVFTSMEAGCRGV